MMSMNVSKRQLLVLSVSVFFLIQGMIVMKSNIYYVLGNPQCSKGWIVIINSWLYDGITDDNDINYDTYDNDANDGNDDNDNNC